MISETGLWCLWHQSVYNYTDVSHDFKEENRWIIK